eukprot:6280147-Prymnesium_polylepis.1
MARAAQSATGRACQHRRSHYRGSPGGARRRPCCSYGTPSPPRGTRSTARPSWHAAGRSRTRHRRRGA